MAGRAIAVDVGSHSIKAIVLKASRNGVQIQRFCCAPAGEGGAAIAAAGISPKGATAGLAGRDMTLRYSQVPPTPDWQLRNLMDLEIQDLSQQSGGTLSADYNLLPSQDPEAGVDTVLLALAKDDALDRIQTVLREADGSADGFVPNCIALYNAWLKCGPVEEDTVVCLANVGHETIDIALVKGQDLLFARNLSGGGKVLDDAIGASFNVSERKAETLKRDLLDLDPQSRGRYSSGQAEKVTMAAGGAANAIVAAIQSSLAFCKSQTKIQDLRLDKVLVAGGSARLRGLRGMLREALRCPVELYDPFQNLDLSALPPGDQEQLQAMRHEAAVVLGLAVGRVDDTLYQLEIQPAAVRRRKRFAERTVFNVVAGAVGIGLLAFYATTLQTKVTTAEGVLTQVKRQESQRKSSHSAAEGQVEANKLDRALVDQLGGQALPLHGLLRTARALNENLPPQLWIKKLEVQPQKGAGGGSKRPLFVVEGAGKELEGVEVGTVFGEFLKKLQGSPLMAGAKVNPFTPATVDNTMTFRLEIDFAPPEGS
jgi:Tfp pilus assembly PilM family ATPase